MTNNRCPQQHELSDYVFGRIDEAVAESMDTHVASCADCQTVLAACDTNDDLLISTLKQEMGEGQFDQEQELRDALEEISKMSPSSSTGVWRTSPDDTARPHATELDGTQIGQYRLLELLGRGGMGTVYKAEHARLEMVVAVKILADRLTNDPRAVARFDREMKAVGKVSHPNLVRATDAGEDGGRHYLAMEFVDGKDLSQLVKTLGPLRVNDACKVIREAAIGIHQAHAQGLIHRDLKPANLMLTHDGHVKVLDLGLARLRIPSATSELTGDFQVMGTADYMAPEQAMNVKRVDERADVYSLGCTLYALLCGKPPFADPQHNAPFKKMMAHDQEQPTSVMLRRREVPAEVSAIVDKALEKLRELRFSSAAELADVLQPFTKGADLARLVERATGANQPTPAEVTKRALTTDTATSLAEPQNDCDRTPRAGNWSRVLVAVAVALLVGGGLFAAIVLRFDVGEGTIVVEIDGDGIITELDGDELVIADKHSDTTYRLSIQGSSARGQVKPGEYTIQLANEASGLRLNTTEFRIERDQRAVVTAYVELSETKALSPATAPTLPAVGSPDATVAQWAMRMGGIVGVLIEDRLVLIDPESVLPTAPFQLEGITFTRPVELGKTEFSQLQALSRLHRLEFQDMTLTDDVLDGLAALPHLTNLKLRFEDQAPRGLDRLSRLTGLVDLTVGGSLVGDAEVATLSQKEIAVRLTISGKQVTDASLIHLAEMEQLEFLSLIFTQVNGQELSRLSKLPKLWGLHLPYTPVTDDGLAGLADLSHMTWLNLGMTQISDDGLRHVASLLTLDTLTLAGSPIRGPGLAHLRDLPNLRTLDLLETKIDDSTLEELAQLAQVTRLLIGDQLSAAAVAELRARLPNCEIVSEF